MYEITLLIDKGMPIKVFSKLNDIFWPIEVDICLRITRIFMTAKNSKKDIGQPISSLLKINDKKVNDMKPNYTNSTQA